MSNKDTFVIFDGNALLHRAFHAIPPLTTQAGVLVNAVYGFTSIFLKVLKELKPGFVAVTFDRKEPTFRHKEFKNYKAQRVKQPQELYDQIPLIKQVVKAFKVPIFELAGYEADDIIGTLAQKVTQGSETVETIIVTGDMDTLQLVDERTKVYTMKKGFNDTILYDEQAVVERYGLTPQQLIDYKALRGDPSDNIPGVKGIGEKTALQIIKTFGSIAELEQALKNNDERLENFSTKIVELLQAAQPEFALSQKLVTIVRNVPLKFNLSECALDGFDVNALVDLFQSLEFKSLLARLPELQNKLDFATPPAPVPVNKKGASLYTLVQTESQLEKVVKKIINAGEVAFDTETSSLDPWTGALVGISVSVKAGEAYFIAYSKALTQTKAWRGLLEVFCDSKISKIGHNSKYDMEVLWRVGIFINHIDFDTLIATYLLRSGERGLDLKTLVFQEFGAQMTTIQELIGKGKDQITMDKVPLEKVSDYACADADYTLRLKQKLEPELKKEGLQKLFTDIEMPLVPVLGRMEQSGVKINIGYLREMSKELQSQINSLEKKIHKLAGREFNINSPKQLKEILFDELNISPEGLKRTKTGISTAASELEKMQGLHPIIDELFEFRELTKLLSTYVDALPQLVNKETGRVHTSFNQTVAATGRLSSTDPNLQNIPIKGEWGKRVRQAFVAESGFTLVSVDYSQIELRIVAHLAQDKKMLEIFKTGQDIHTTTAAYVFDVELNKVTPDQRRSAKEVNFGVLYGMGAWGLAERTNLTHVEAKQFIDRYFKTFSGVARWIEQIKQEAGDRGYVATLFGRRRKLPEIHSGVPAVRAAAERMAINLPVQGTAADLIKVAMIKVAFRLSQVSPTSRMLMQVHDELVFEVPLADVTKVATMVKQEMETVVAWEVPIVAEVKVGDNWGSMSSLATGS